MVVIGQFFTCQIPIGRSQAAKKTPFIQQFAHNSCLKNDRKKTYFTLRLSHSRQIPLGIADFFFQCTKHQMLFVCFHIFHFPFSMPGQELITSKWYLFISLTAILKQHDTSNRSKELLNCLNSKINFTHAPNMNTETNTSQGAEENT